MEDDNNIGRAQAEAQDYNDLEVDTNDNVCGKYNTLCHIVGGLLLGGLIVGLITMGIVYIG